MFIACCRSWEARLGRVAIHLPPSLDHLTDTAKSTLAYILINRDGHALRPGTRCYARSWIRDGALIAAALLQMGHAEEVRDFILWYGPHQSENGKIPCRVDGRGPDPTPEHDSHGEFVYLVMEYHRYTQDRALLEALWPRVQKAIAHIEALRHERMTAAYRMPDKPQQAHAVPDDRIFATLTALDLDRVLARAGGIDVERDWDDILSLDEQQLLAAARVLYAAPRFAFLDRLATALSPTQEERVLQLLFARSISYVTITETDEPTDRYDAVLDLTGGGAWTWSQIPP